MKPWLKNSFKIAAILFITLFIFVGSFFISTKLKKVRDSKRIENMYSRLSTTGKLHTERYVYTYLTKTGKERLKPDLTFDSKDLKLDTLVAFSEQQAVLSPLHFEGTIDLPKNPSKGQRLYFKVPFPFTVNEDLVLRIYYKDHYIDYDYSNIQSTYKKRKLINYVYLGESTDSKGNLINDLKLVKDNPSSKVSFSISGVEKSYDNSSPKEFLRHPSIYYSGKELLKDPVIKLNIAYNEKSPEFKVSIPNYSKDNLQVIVKKNYTKDYQRYVQIALKPQGKLLQDLKKDPNKVTKFNLLYTGLVTKSQYYITSNLSYLSNFNNGK